MLLEEALTNVLKNSARLARGGITTAEAVRATRYLAGGRALGKSRHAKLVAARHELLLAAVEDRWWAPWRKRRRLARIESLEATLRVSGLPW